ncbi:hypothetical protein PUNSTDRAFT_101453 [Punctularia strigosozonata HHB-11173 SS5]|uniref:uncharacterized protein n=1 Tax=Punctularia strigosozonata (strain HHB-11173) TaxID=741275 RepID=UPI0004416F44|nr:uncharacterized protein PUNSTDRAFT_101453 [Punctularia strigosozonata HHB-11173 SS5]EIN09576.1 hypothetical protein PUNSTDRAFT_101453 [Punctularia strigosozonata HHB-11173 SS5]
MEDKDIELSLASNPTRLSDWLVLFRMFRTTVNLRGGTNVETSFETVDPSELLRDVSDFHCTVGSNQSANAENECWARRLASPGRGKFLSLQIWGEDGQDGAECREFITLPKDRNFLDDVMLLYQVLGKMYSDGGRMVKTVQPSFVVHASAPQGGHSSQILSLAPLTTPSNVQCPDTAVILFQQATELLEHLGNHDCDDPSAVSILLNEVIALNQEALALFPEDHPSRAEALANLALAFQKQYDRNRDADTLARSIELHRRALSLRPRGHPQRSVPLSRLAVGLIKRYDRDGTADDLTEAIDLRREVLSLHPEGRQGRAGCLNSLANALSTHYAHSGLKDALLEVIALNREALALQGEGNPDRELSLNNLANALSTLYERYGNADALLESISLHRAHVKLCHEGHPDRALVLSNLADTLCTYYGQYGDTASLAEAIDMCRESLALRHEPGPDRGMSLSNLASALREHYEYYGDTDSLTEAIALHREAVTLFSGERVPNRYQALHNLTNALSAYHERYRDPTTFAEIVDLRREILSFHPEGHPERDRPLSTLASTLKERHQHYGDSDSLMEAIKLDRQAVALCPTGHPYRAMHLNNLANALASDFDSSDDIENLNEAIMLYREAISVYLQRFERMLPLGGAGTNASVELLHSLLDAYDQTIKLMPHIALVGLDPVQRLSSLEGAQWIAVNAAVRALHIDQVPRAIELLEQGRAVFWSQALRLRTQFDELPSGMSRKLMDLAKVLEDGPDHCTPSSDQGPNVPGSSAAVGGERRRKSEEFERLIEEVRRTPGLERFLLHEPLSSLSDAATNGPVILLVPGAAQSHALILRAGSPPLHVQLLDITESVAAGYAEALRRDGAEYRSMYRKRKMELRANDSGSTGFGALQASPPNCGDEDEECILQELWIRVVRPIIRGTQIVDGPRRPRVTWMPTGQFAFLPVHAAGIYKGEPQYLSQYVVSSYTPTLSALHTTESEDTEPDASESSWEYIEGVYDEIDAVRRVTSTVKTTVIEREREGAMPTSVNSVIEQLPGSTILHLACHGQQDAEGPLESAFKLGDGDLTIGKLMKLNLPDAMFAYLSACETSKGDSYHPDQAIHLAAAMLFTGFRSVIATMW